MTWALSSSSRRLLEELAGTSAWSRPGQQAEVLHRAIAAVLGREAAWYCPDRGVVELAGVRAVLLRNDAMVADAIVVILAHLVPDREALAAQAATVLLAGLVDPALGTAVDW